MVVLTKDANELAAITSDAKAQVCYHYLTACPVLGARIDCGCSTIHVSDYFVFLPHVAFSSLDQ